MIFDNIHFRRTRRIGFRDDPEDNRYTEFYQKSSGKPIPTTQSLTNMGFAKSDGRAYLVVDGQVWTAPGRKS